MRRPLAAFFCFTALAACGDTEDPFQTDVIADTGTADAGVDVNVDVAVPDVSLDGTDDDGTTADVTPGDVTPGDVTPEDTGSEDTGGEDVVAFPCGDDVIFTGQAFRSGDEPASSPNGGIPSFEPYATDYDSGLAAIDDAIPSGEDPATIELQVTGATIVATSYNNDTARRAQNTFWVMDGLTMLEVRLDQDDLDAQPPFAVQVGLQIDFTATSVTNYFDTPQLSSATGWAISEGSDGNAPIYFFEPAEGANITFADWPTNIRVTGTITGGGDGCGGSSLCWDLDYGGTTTLDFRTSSQFIEIGDCITFAGPLGQFQETPQVNTTNFDWLFDYRQD
ncbi:MAG: hypothetical protein ACI81R_000552 [Bradymonadia bacterium]|jgi:hypothetical protein